MKEVIKYYANNVTKKSVMNYMLIVEPWSNNSMYVKHGMCMIFYSNGELKMKGEYCFGKRRGVWTYFTEYGVMCNQTQYRFSNGIEYFSEDALLEDSESDYETESESEESEEETNDDIKMKLSDEVFEVKDKLTDNQFKSIMELLQKIT